MNSTPKPALQLFAILMLTCLSAFPDPVSGVVFGVSDTEIEILVSSGKMPTKGMVAEVYKKTEGEEVLVGTWSVTRTDVNTVYASPISVSGAPKLGQTVRIDKAKPKPQPVAVPVAPPVENTVPVVETSVAPPVENDVPVAETPVSPQPQKRGGETPREKAPGKTIQLSAMDQSLLDDLASGNSARIRNAAKYLYRGRYEDPVVMDKAAEVLQQQFNLKTKDAIHVDGMAWICKALWASGEEKYLPTLRVVESQTRSPKLRKYAIKYRAALEQKNR